MSETVEDAFGELPVFVHHEVRCPWCQAKAAQEWDDSLERAIQREVEQRQRKHTGGRPYPLRLDERVEDEEALEALRAQVKAICAACDRPFRVVRMTDLGTYVMHGARSDKDEEYMRWKAQRDAAAGVS
jgi:glutathione S-transferase